VVYTSSSLALAALETFVHVDVPEEATDLVMVRADIAADVGLTRLQPSQLPRDWRTYPRPEALADMGSKWIEAGATPVLAVPSVIIPSEPNYLLNPRHPDFRRIRVGRPQPFSFDPRLWKRA
jgi:RES domain-containing protein